MLALRVTSDFESKIHNGSIAVEDIQDSVESILIQSGYADVAKAYILYFCGQCICAFLSLFRCQ